MSPFLLLNFFYSFFFIRQTTSPFFILFYYLLSPPPYFPPVSTRLIKLDRIYGLKKFDTTFVSKTHSRPLQENFAPRLVAKGHSAFPQSISFLDLFFNCSLALQFFSFLCSESRPNFGSSSSRWLKKKKCNSGFIHLFVKYWFINWKKCSDFLKRKRSKNVFFYDISGHGHIV